MARLDIGIDNKRWAAAVNGRLERSDEWRVQSAKYRVQIAECEI
jgi:hypothetical protein